MVAPTVLPLTESFDTNSSSGTPIKGPNVNSFLYKASVTSPTSVVISPDTLYCQATARKTEKEDDKSSDDGLVIKDDSGVQNQTVTRTQSSLDYIPFDDDVIVSGHKEAVVDKRIFIPLYTTTMLLLALPVLPSPLRILLVLLWGILFLVTPIWYLYHYTPCVEACACCTDSMIRRKNTTVQTPSQELSSYPNQPPQTRQPQDFVRV